MYIAALNFFPFNLLLESVLLVLDSFKLADSKYNFKLNNPENPSFTEINKHCLRNANLKKNNQIMYKLMEGTTFALDDGQSFVIYV